MKQKLIEYLTLHPTDVNGNTSTRWLSKKEPELWQWILKSTAFLPNTAKPKQRVWHILNDVDYTPLCPVDEIPVKWHENRYLTYSSRSAKGRCPDHKDRRLSAYKKKTGFNHWGSKENTEGYEKRKQTCFDNWGGVWPNATDEVYSKFIKTKSDNGHCRTDEEKSALEIYMSQVEEHTKDSWYYSYSRINPDGLERGKEYHLDHIYSRKAGFDNKIPPEIIGHWTNLRLMPARENNGKSSKSDKTIEKLFEDYQNNSR